MIEIKNVCKKFDRFEALKNISSNIEEGSIYGMVGSNGAGKSTLLRVLAGIYKPDNGVVEFNSKAVYNNPDVKKDICFVGDELFFLPGANLKNMASFYKDIYDDFNIDKFKELVASFKLDINKNIGYFSKGMRRQAAIILALSTNAKYLLFDETFDGLDPVVRRHVKNLLYDKVLQGETTIIISSHSLRELEDLCDHLILIHQGGLVLDSDVLDLKTHKFKVQVAFKEEFDKTKFDGFEIINFVKQGSVANIIINGNKDEVYDKLSSLNPILLEILPLTLEEVFIYEMENQGYCCKLEELAM